MNKPNRYCLCGESAKYVLSIRVGMAEENFFACKKHVETEKSNLLPTAAYCIEEVNAVLGIHFSHYTQKDRIHLYKALGYGVPDYHIFLKELNELKESDIIELFELAGIK